MRKYKESTPDNFFNKSKILEKFMKEWQPAKVETKPFEYLEDKIDWWRFVK